MGSEQAIRRRLAVGVRACGPQDHGSNCSDAGGGGEGLADGSEEMAAHQLPVVHVTLGGGEGAERHTAGVGHRRLGGNSSRIGHQHSESHLVCPYGYGGCGCFVVFVGLAERV